MNTSSKERCIFMYTCGRSGHHAVINWLQKQWPGISHHHNHVFRGWEEQQLLAMHHKAKDKGITTHENEGDKVLHIYSVEDLLPTHFASCRIGHFPMFQDFYRVDVLWHVRDPFNWIASSVLKDGAGAKPHIIQQNEMGFRGTRIQIYNAQIDEWYREENMKFVYIPHLSIHRDINYTKWVLEKSYREELCKQLDIPFTDAGKDEVPKFGGGSTFDGMNLQGKASQMHVLDRWQKGMADARFWFSLGAGGKKMIDFSKDYFGFDPTAHHLGVLSYV